MLICRNAALVRGGSEVDFPWTDGQPLGFGECPETEIAQGGVQRRRQGGGVARLPPWLVHSLYKSQEVRSKIISKLVGHSSEAFTAKVYDHAEQSEIREALAVVGWRLEPKMEPNRILDETNP